MKNCFIILFSALAIVACASTDNTANNNSSASGAATTVYFNAQIYTVDESNPWAEAIAVRDGKIVAIGSNADVLSASGVASKKIDLGTRMVMPGIHDTHIHPMDAGISKNLECSFRSPTLDEALAVIRQCVADVAPGEWVRGGQWNEGYFSDGRMPKDILDEVAPDNPAFFMDWSVHHAWVNTAALKKLGITAESEDPIGGVIKKDPATGEPVGLLLDNAAYIPKRQLPKYSLSERSNALLWSLNSIASFGVTTIRDAIVNDDIMEAYVELADSGRLPLRTQTSLTWKSAWADSHEAEKALIERRDEYRRPWINPDFAKIMLDGVPMSYTSAVLEPYEPNDVVGANHKGKMMIEPDQLIEDVVALDKAGLTIKIHATGDASARASLDAFEAAKKRNGDSGLRHEVSHAEMIHPDDIPRFKSLNVVAEMCPIIWYPVPGLDWETWFGPDRVPVWQVRTLHQAGALVSYGSDWPVVPTANPWPGVEAMVTRADPYSDNPTTEFAEESVDLATALQIFTLNSAIANKAGANSGSLEVGKDADFIVLDRNLFSVPIQEVSDTTVLMSVIGGDVLFDNTSEIAAPEAAVRAVVQEYLDATSAGDVARLKAVFHPNAGMFGYMQGQFLTGGPEPYIEAVSAMPMDDAARASYEYEIASVEVNGAIARATLEERGLFGMNFITHFHLARDPDKVWKITSKSFSVL